MLINYSISSLIQLYEYLIISILFNNIIDYGIILLKIEYNY
jgi:hypothetical protein